ncbi:MFS transporter [Brumimicrobium aurantiacum]|uniref:MFS transporter n=1 Tax=Brumimicrobium aurantiacum TaxID=1737063 RepID=A0A3E1EYI3_9FLAO|nr:MFS transporter [Brumimicrobium aurantiacum]RFC54620.1 MFS transporter [Brumimicrobium aurantiacum]
MDYKKTIKEAQIIHLVITGVLVLIYVFLGDLTVEMFKIPEITSDDYFFIAIPIVAFFLGNYLYRRQVQSTDEKLSIEKKCEVFKTATIMRLAILEGAALVILFLAPNLVFFGALIVLNVVMMRPTEGQFQKDFD